MFLKPIVCPQQAEKRLSRKPCKALARLFLADAMKRLFWALGPSGQGLWPGQRALRAGPGHIPSTVPGLFQLLMDLF